MNDKPWCTCGTTKSRQEGWTRDAEGVWVCPVCRKPSRMNHQRLLFARGDIDRLTHAVLR